MTLTSPGIEQAGVVSIRVLNNVGTKTWLPGFVVDHLNTSMLVLIVEKAYNSSFPPESDNIINSGYLSNTINAIAQPKIWQQSPTHEGSPEAFLESYFKQ